MQKHSQMEAQRLDIITTVPQAIIETILCLLPIKDAARTSILSRKWRYKWTTIPRLVFFDSLVKLSAEERLMFRHKKKNDLQTERRNLYIRCKFFHAIRQVLLQRQGPIHEFALGLVADDTCAEIDQMMLHLSRNHTVKKLEFCLRKLDHERGYAVPLSAFSLQHHLTHLCFEYCEVNLKPIVNQLDSVTSLTLERTWISRETLLHLLSKCPSLKKLFIMLENHRRCYDNASIMELFKCLPQIEHLTTWGYIWPVEDWVPEEITVSLINLKYFCIRKLHFLDCNGLRFFGILTKFSPNLEKIKLEIETSSYCFPWMFEDQRLEKYSVILEEYSDVQLEHLNELEIKNYENLKLELLVKFILVRSPNLRKVIFSGTCNWEEESETILQAPRASRAEIVVEKSREMIKLNFVQNY